MKAQTGKYEAIWMTKKSLETLKEPEGYLSGSVALLAPPGLVCVTGTTGSAAGAGVNGGCAVVR